MPSIPGIEDVGYLTSTSALALEALPKSLLVIGGGYIGAELAQMFARMGVKVTIVCRSKLLPAAEPEIAEVLSGYFRDEGIELQCGVAYRSVKRTDTGISLAVTKERLKMPDRSMPPVGDAPVAEPRGRRSSNNIKRQQQQQQQRSPELQRAPATENR